MTTHWEFFFTGKLDPTILQPAATIIAASHQNIAKPNHKRVSLIELNLKH
jgi:hypothetical protein